MRFSAQERAAVRKIVHRLDPRAKIYLFGSRADDSLRGDIDLLIVSDHLHLADKIDLLVKMKDALGEQKIDILIKTAKESRSDPFVRQIMKSAVAL